MAYVEGIESVLRAHRGADQPLSPRDFSLARSWFEAGVPLAAVLVAIDASFAAGGVWPGLRALRRRVEDLAAPGGIRHPHESPRTSLPELAQALGELRERLLELPARAAARCLAQLDEVAALVAVATRPNWDYLRQQLEAVDALASAAAVDALDPGALEGLRQEASHASEHLRDRVEPQSLAAAVERLVRQRARDAARLPRVGLY